MESTTWCLYTSVKNTLFVILIHIKPPPPKKTGTISWPGAVTPSAFKSSTPTHHTFDDLVLAVMLLHLQKVVAEVEDVEASVLSKEGDDHAASPVEAVSEALPGKREWQRVSN